MVLCTYCNKNYKNDKGLLVHQKRPSCLKNKESTVEPVLYECKYCGKCSSNKQALQYHLKICKVKIIIKETELEKAHREIKEKDLLLMEKNLLLIEKNLIIKQNINLINTLNIEIKELVYRPIIINNTTNINIDKYIQANFIPITNKLLESNIPNLTLNHVLGKGEGFGKYALEYPLQGNTLLCTDISRRIGKYLNDEEKLQKDLELKAFSARFFGCIFESSKQCLDKYIKRCNFDLSDEAQFKSQNDLVQIICNVRKEANGNFSDLRLPFLKTICSAKIKDNFNFC